uniref:Uncharacterized protein n=1 Tax=Spodoptera frugiperda nuclear polyhedrosis virus TaxID=10455 RepID=B2KX56_NPVSF|nr:unknown [Spodoptera frugiperda multiple nucleopolyhedrovirus]QWS70925.1 hypothetical protein [Spodoptera frugiperda multiple nucleopolyhedrovirus]
MVMVKVTKTRLNGIHEAIVMEGQLKNYTAALIVPPTTSHRRLIYEGLILEAIIIRHNGPHVDLLLLK